VRAFGVFPLCGRAPPTWRLSRAGESTSHSSPSDDVQTGAVTLLDNWAYDPRRDSLGAFAWLARKSRDAARSPDDDGDPGWRRRDDGGRLPVPSYSTRWVLLLAATAGSRPGGRASRGHRVPLLASIARQDRLWLWAGIGRTRLRRWIDVEIDNAAGFGRPGRGDARTPQKKMPAGRNPAGIFSR
jgi:hypothetical protein